MAAATGGGLEDEDINILITKLQYEDEGEALVILFIGHQLVVIIDDCIKYPIRIVRMMKKKFHHAAAGSEYTVYGS